jgi:threonine dehydratase
MADLILVHGDKAQFLPNFGPAVVVVKPGTLTASGAATLNKKKVCVDGDEATVTVPGCIYMTPQYSISGAGTLKIAALAADQKAKKTKSRGKAVLLKGGNFTAKFEVQSPAKQPPPGTTPPIPDATPQYSGSGMFITTNTKFRGT